MKTLAKHFGLAVRI